MEPTHPNLNSISHGNPFSKLPFIEVELGKRLGKTVSTPALIDSGATHTYINESLFGKVENNHKHFEKTEINPIRVTVANKEEVTLTHTAIVPIWVKDVESQWHKIEWKTYVATNLYHDLYLGTDLIGSDLVENWSKKVMNMVLFGKSVQIPVHWKGGRQTSMLLSRQPINIPPHTIRVVPAKPAKKIPKTDHRNKLVIAEEMEEGDGTYSITAAIQTRNDLNEYEVYMMNETDQWINIPDNTPIARISPLNQDLGVLDPVTNTIRYPCNSHNQLINKQLLKDAKIIKEEILPQLNMISHESRKRIREQLEEDHNEEEINEKLAHLDEEGFLPHSPEYLAEKIHSMCDITPPDSTEEPTAEKLVQKIKLDHLKPEEAEKVRDIFRKHHSVLARHLWDCPKSPLVEAFIPLKEDCTKTCQNCQYRPIPLEQRQKVQEAIEMLEKSGIVEKCYKATPFISNILCGKRKDGSPRILLDTRIINNATTKLPCTMNSIQEIYSSFSEAKHCSTLDISNCFYAIGIREEDRPYFSFYDTRKIRYTFSRCPQGFKNSPYWMNNLLSQVIIDSPNTLMLVYQ